jgi:hypothetical protein
MLLILRHEDFIITEMELYHENVHMKTISRGILSRQISRERYDNMALQMEKGW